MNTLLLILSILFLIAGVVGGSMEKDIGMMLTGIVLAIVLFAWRLNRIKNKELIEEKKTARKQAKNERRQYQFFMTDEGKKVLMPYVPKDELETYSWSTIAHTYSTEAGYKVLMERVKEEVEAEMQEEQEEE